MGADAQADGSEERRVKLRKIVKLFTFFSLILIVSQLVLTTLITRDIYNQYKGLYHKVVDFGNQTSLEIFK